MKAARALLLVALLSSIPNEARNLLLHLSSICHPERSERTAYAERQANGAAGSTHLPLITNAMDSGQSKPHRTAISA